MSAGCKLRAALPALGDLQHAHLSVDQCGSFVPVISFKDRTGLDQRFNTFRKGRGWANRVILDQCVGLYDTTANEMLGFAQVVSIHVGPLAGLLVHAPQNHLMKHLPPPETSSALHKILAQLYGRTYAGLDRDFCVIVMERLHLN